MVRRIVVALRELSRSRAVAWFQTHLARSPDLYKYHTFFQLGFNRSLHGGGDFKSQIVQ